MELRELRTLFSHWYYRERPRERGKQYKLELDPLSVALIDLFGKSKRLSSTPLLVNFAIRNLFTQEEVDSALVHLEKRGLDTLLQHEIPGENYARIMSQPHLLVRPFMELMRKLSCPMYVNKDNELYGEYWVEENPASFDKPHGSVTFYWKAKDACVEDADMRLVREAGLYRKLRKSLD